MSQMLLKFILVLVAILAAASQIATAAEIQEVLHGGRKAYRLSDGKTEAIVVPDFGRVMHYGIVGGRNWLWTNQKVDAEKTGWQNWGGDKLFVGPHDSWRAFAASIWPPQASWDATPHTSEVLPNGHLRMTSPVWSGFGIRLTRTFSFDSEGNFLIAESMEKISGEPRLLCLWNVSQAVPPDAVVLLANPMSAYNRGFHGFGRANRLPVETFDSGLLVVKPSEGMGYKIGVDSPVAAILALKDGMGWLQTTEKTKGEYPDGAIGSGFPVELYNHKAKGADAYIEMELLSPLYRFEPGMTRSRVLRWSLHPLDGDLSSAATSEAVKSLLLRDKDETPAP